MLHQQFSQDYTLYPLQIEAKIDEIEYDILDIHGAHKKLKYLDYLADNTPFGMVEIDMAKIVTKEVYQDNLKQIQSRQKTRLRRKKGEDVYNKQVEKKQDQLFQQYKEKALSSIGGGHLSKPQVIKNTQYVKQESEMEMEKRVKEEEAFKKLEDDVKGPPISIENYTEEEESKH